MGEKLVVGPINKGLKKDVLPFNIDNDSFPTLINAYQWRGRVKRKRGTSLLGRLRRFIGTTNGAGNLVVTVLPIPIPTGISSFVVGSNVFTDPGTTANPGVQTLLTNGPGTATLDRVNGILTIAGSNINTSVIFYPSLPVMGLEDLNLNPNQAPGTIAFDTRYSYNISTAFPYAINDVSFYKNPAADPINLPGYIPKTAWTPISWNGQDYQQFWTTNYQGAFWATNGVNVPFTITNIGMQFKPIVTTTVTAGGPPAIVTLQITGHGLVVGDFLYINEVVSTTGINFQTGYVIAVIDANNVSVEFPFATIATNGTGGIAQYLTNRSDVTKDCIRWYDGDPTDGNSTSPTFVQGKGWVNFAPPLSQGDYSIADLPADQYYLVGAKMIVPFKDRLLFFGPVVQTSSSIPNPIYLQDTVIYSQNGTPYYTSSYTNNPDPTVDTPTSPTNTFHPVLLPTNQTATAPAFFEDQTGFGGFLTAGISEAYITISSNEDVLIAGFTQSQARVVYSGNDIVPFNIFLINSELGTSSTFSLINMNEGIITKGNRGYIMTSQVGSQRIDLDIPDQVFEVSLTNNGNERVCAQRDFINEWIYFTYPSNQVGFKFPNQTLQYNYRDNSYALFNETYTTYGPFQRQSGQTWLTLPVTLTWNTWNTPWNSGGSTLLQPLVIAGNQQGFVLFRADRTAGTNEATSLYIQNVSGNVVTSPNHCLNDGDYIVISGVLGTIGTQVNGKIFSVYAVTTNTFSINPSISSGTYLGGGYITRMYVPFIQTKQFPVSWSLARKVRIGAQQYLLTNTPNGQITLQIYLSQNDSYPYNLGPIVPAALSTNNSLVYNSVLFTSPERYIQKCNNIPLGTIGNGVLTSFVFSYFVLFNLTENLVPGSVFIQVGNVATFTDDGIGGFTATGTGTSVGSSISYSTGIVTIAFTVAPTSQVTTTNFNYYVINLQAPSSNVQNQIWHRMNTSLIGDSVQLGFTMSDEQMRDTTFSNQFEEIEIHGFVMDLTASQVLI